MNIYTNEAEYLKTEVQRLSALVRAQQITIDKLEQALAAPVQEPVTWRNAAIRVGEDLCSVGPFGYYDMTAEQWLDWALSVVTVHAPPAAQRQWVGLTDEEISEAYNAASRKALYGMGPTRVDVYEAIESKLKEKNT